MWKTITALLGLAALVACEPDPPPPEPEPVVEAAPPPPPPERLGDARWSITHINGTPTPNRTVLDIAGQFISGQTPCNRVTGNYLGTGPIFNVKILSITSQACGVEDFENALVTNLLEAKSADIDEAGVLRVRDAEQVVTLQFEPVVEG